jgi:hypothetical protein
MTSWNHPTRKQKAYDAKLDAFFGACTALWLTFLCLLVTAGIGVIITILHNIGVIP